MSNPVLPSGASLERIFLPLPDTQRGYGINIDTTKKDRLLAYGNGTNVVIRSLDDPSKGDLFTEHKAKVNVAKFSPNGEWVASGDDSGRVLVWGLKNKIIKNDVPAARKVLDIAWSADGQRVVAVGDGNEQKAKVFPWDTSNQIGEVTGHAKAILSVAYRPERPFKIVTASEDLLVGLHKGPPFSFEASFKEHTRYPNCVRYTPDGKFIVSVGADQKIYVLDGSTATKVREIESKENGHKGAIYSFSFSPDGKQLLTASSDKTAKIWDFESGEVKTTFTFPDVVENMQVGTAWQGDTLISVSLSGAINYLDVSNPAAPKQVLHGHQRAPTDVAVDRANNVVYTCCVDGRLTAWSLETGLGKWFTGKGSVGVPLVNIALLNGGTQVATVSVDDKLRIQEAKAGAWSENAVALGGAPTSSAVGSKSGVLLVGLGQEHVVIVRNGAVAAKIPLKFRPLSIAIHPDESEVVISGEDKKLHVYALQGDELKETAVHEHRQPSDTVAYSHNGRYVAAGDRDRYIIVRDRTDGWKEVTPDSYRYHSAKVTSVAWSPSDDALASSSTDLSAYVWPDTNTFNSSKGRKFEMIHRESVSHARFVSDKLLLTSGGDRAVKLWNL